ncbi:HAMP domain-containing sensor histidine kinase [Desulfoplanes formicivorans]|uniref:histidine kinase n=1 Tax=Desulfoplanes formicivorans TaxID=1592317 RepID=A0A194AED0_9BACT|nr:HAMP domain-containing sensor histidine kinase [Desulfoplanes formicivorans]GAU07476.1 histidine kinase [Desulfoplanes formicivorans]
MQNLSFRAKMLLAFVVILICALIVPSLIYRHKMVATIRDDALTTAKAQLNTVAWLLASHDRPYTEHALDQRLATLKKHLGVRITVVDINGNVVADSDVPLDQVHHLDNHASRPEIAQAQVQPMGVSVRFSATQERDLIYIARQLTLPGMGSGMVRIALPYSHVQEILDHMTRSFWGLLALTLGIFALLTTLLANQMTRSINNLVSMAISIGEGKYSNRIRIAPGKEFAPLLKAINHMAQKIQTNIETITSQKMELEAILNGMKEGVVALDSAGNILEWNRSMETIFPHILGKKGHRLIEAIRIPELETTCQSVLHNKVSSPQTVSLQLTTHDNRSYDVNIVPTGKEEPKVIVVFHDITEINRLEMIRKDFVANVSHELRTPLTSIKGYTETLMDLQKDQDENATRFLRIILKHTDAMAGILNDLLNLARLESSSDGNEISVQPVQVKPAMAMAQKSLAHLVESKKIHIKEDLSPGDCTVLVNPAHLEQVFKNLLENAVKYAPEMTGSICIRIRDCGDECLFEIEDNGPGIPLKEQDRIFERFYRVEKDRNSKIAGTGLGLAICKHIVQQHGGRIWVTSPLETSSGSRFSFTLKKV